MLDLYIFCLDGESALASSTCGVVELNFMFGECLRVSVCKSLIILFSKWNREFQCGLENCSHGVPLAFSGNTMNNHRPLLPFLEKAG